MRSFLVLWRAQIMLKMRLQRIGRKNNPTYRVLVVDSRQGPKSGKYIDQLGSYDPKDGAPKIDTEKAKAWIAKGVQVSPTVHNMLVDLKAVEGKKINVLPKKSPIVDESAKAAAEEAAQADEGTETEKATEETTTAPAEGTETEDKKEEVVKEEVPAEVSDSSEETEDKKEEVKTAA